MGPRGPKKRIVGNGVSTRWRWVRGDPFSEGEGNFFGVEMYLELRSPMFGESCVMIFYPVFHWLTGYLTDSLATSLTHFNL